MHYLNSKTGRQHLRQSQRGVKRRIRNVIGHPLRAERDRKDVSATREFVEFTGYDFKYIRHARICQFGKFGYAQMKRERIQEKYSIVIFLE